MAVAAGGREGLPGQLGRRGREKRRREKSRERRKEGEEKERDLQGCTPSRITPHNLLSQLGSSLSSSQNTLKNYPCLGTKHSNPAPTGEITTSKP